MRVYLISTYPPRACGIATFAQNLFKSITKPAGQPVKARIIAISDQTVEGQYPSEVEQCLMADSQPAYEKMAGYLNQRADAVILQHEYGIFGGQDGAYVLSLLKNLDCPTAVTLHTVLKNPSQGQRYVIQQIAAHTDCLVVMSQMARQFLTEVYQIPPTKIKIIKHGVPDFRLADRDALRQKLGFEDRKMLLTFGLLGRGKGIETAINALPAIVGKHPETLYLVLGRTHPAIVRENGEEYREQLLALAEEKGVRDNLRFIDRFVDEEELWEYLQACDVYVVPYLNEAQITSGTLSYAIGAGAAVVSTPFWHAQELLADGKGLLFDFCNPEALANVVNSLLGSPGQINSLRSKARAYGQQLKWSLAGKQYIALAQRLVVQQPSKCNIAPMPLFDKTHLNLTHLKTLTDSTGILQHAKYSVPNRWEGYCIDDNARALIVAIMASKSTRDPWLQSAISTYLAFMYHCQNEDGTFHNFMSYDRRFLDETGSEDSFGRTIWALGFALANLPASGLTSLAREMFQKALPHIKQLQSPRSMAYCLLGICCALNKNTGDEHLLILLDYLRNQLVSQYRKVSDEKWHWFEEYFTYSNGILPYSLFCSLEILPDEAVAEVAEESTRFLEELTIKDGMCQPIGCHGFYIKGQDRPYFDQQPVDVMAKILLFLQAFKVTEEHHYYQNALNCMEWFYGKNALNLPLYDSVTNGCCDGLTATGVNLNQGAESTLSFLMANMAVQEAAKAKKQRGKAGMAGMGKNGHLNLKEKNLMKVA